MSIVAVVKIYMGAECPSGRELFLQLLDSVVAWRDSNPAFSSIAIRPCPVESYGAAADEVLSAAELRRYVADLEPGSPSNYHADFSFRGRTGRFVDGAVASSLDAWDDAMACRAHRPGREEGEAEITVWNFDVLCVPSSAFSDAGRKDELENREGVLEALTEGLISVIDRMHPASVKVFTDATIAYPFNAHFAYYASEGVLIDDLKFIADLWEHGDSHWGLPPLKECEGDLRKYFGSLRPKEVSGNLWLHLQSTIHAASFVDAAMIKEELQSQNHDYFSRRDGFAVLDYPFFMNAYIDPFYLGVLRRAGMRSVQLGSVML